MTDRLNVYLSKVVHTAFKAYSLLKVLDVKIGAKIMVGCYFCNLARFGEDNNGERQDEIFILFTQKAVLKKEFHRIMNILTWNCMKFATF